MNGDAVMNFHAAQAATGEADSDSLIRCERALEAMLTNRGNPVRDVDRVLADNHRFVFGHCLRAALIVRTDDTGARSKLVASATAIEALCPDISEPAHRHAAAARAWLAGDQALAVE